MMDREQMTAEQDRAFDAARNTSPEELRAIADALDYAREDGAIAGISQTVKASLSPESDLSLLALKLVKGVIALEQEIQNSSIIRAGRAGGGPSLMEKRMDRLESQLDKLRAERSIIIVALIILGALAAMFAFA